MEDPPSRVGASRNPPTDESSKGAATKAKAQGFLELGLDPWLVQALAQMTIHHPTEIQRECIPPTLAGRDIIGGAKTGSGKTAAFALPIIQKLSEEPFGVFALVLTPTRELAFQIADQFRVLGKYIKMRTQVVVGGADIATQVASLVNRPHIVVATPGRLGDLIRTANDALHLSHLQFLVMDEADRLLGPSFQDDLHLIFDRIPKKRQTLLYTATMNDTLLSLQNQTEDPARKPFVHVCPNDIATVSSLVQTYVLAPSQVRETYLFYLLTQRDLANHSTIIFVTKCVSSELLRLLLRHLKIKCASLHSQMTLNERRDSVRRFRSGEIPVLIATDVASRGLDIPTVRLVINYELPLDPTTYIHRVGRTARAGLGGRAVSIVSERDLHLVKQIEERVKCQMQKQRVVESKVSEFMSFVNTAKRAANMLIGWLQPA
ncbi:P-loop containing nucleoside triphosphate hydrolase protein [Dimargaris cristalligena]|uniref:P-loop containing nucleoside triphosphate hydrolase protein n=1 Tax=Dimargaris cristalligena TaxID=215637 RepID=A0A4V1J501_9FUNG|nr:P-loop containing nucleoside triphosphate hydrolase protein [Dimargaris cristalligena]|eukprot:RKP37339.1 P-loop containing nucleoside triphosphate hydrolase protein [Dimargaris cristalligena]